MNGITHYVPSYTYIDSDDYDPRTCTLTFLAGETENEDCIISARSDDEVGNPNDTTVLIKDVDGERY